MLLSYILFKKISRKQSCVLFDDLLPPFQGHKLISANTINKCKQEWHAAHRKQIMNHNEGAKMEQLV
jgi:hypothetical protein